MTRRGTAIRRGPLAIVGALTVADSAYAFQQTAVIPALPDVEHDLHASAAWTAWLLGGYLIVACISAPLLGKLGDRYGKRRMLAAALVVFLGGSIGAALAPSLAVLIVFRSVQGVGGAVFPLSFSIARDEVDPKRLTSAIGVLTGAFGLGSAAGLGLSGVLVATGSWRTIFAVGAIALATLLAWTVIPRSRVRSEQALDVAGAALLGGGLAVLLVGITEGPQWQWLTARTIGAIVGGLVLLALWVLYELRTREPMLDLRVLRSRPVLVTNGVTLALGYVLFGAYFLVPHFVQAPPHGPAGAAHGFGASTLGAGLYLLPAAIGQLSGGPLGGVLGRRGHGAATLTGGMALCGAGAALLAVWHAAGWQVVIATFLLGLGFGSATSVASDVITRAAPERETGVATALNSVARRVGGAVGAQVGAVLLLALAAANGGPAASSFRVAFWTAAAIALAGAGAAAVASATGRRAVAER